MPLSEHEERILAEIERQLAADDPRFAARSRRGPGSPCRAGRARLRLRLAVGLGMVGVAAACSRWPVTSRSPAVGMVLHPRRHRARRHGRQRAADSRRTRRAPSPDDAL